MMSKQQNIVSVSYNNTDEELESKIKDAINLHGIMHKYLLNAIFSYETLITADVCVKPLSNTYEANAWQRIRWGLWQDAVLSLRKIHEPGKPDKATVDNVLSVLSSEELLEFLKEQYENKQVEINVTNAVTGERITDPKIVGRYKSNRNFLKLYLDLKNDYGEADNNDLRIKLKKYRDYIAHSTTNERIPFRVKDLELIISKTIVILNGISFILNDSETCYSFFKDDANRYSKRLWESLVHGYTDLQRIRLETIENKRKVCND